MKLAHIVPSSLLDTLPVEQHTHLVLSSVVLSDNRYSAFYSERVWNGDTVILDNPVHENKPVSIDTWLKATEILMPHVAVIPDVIDSDADTLRNAEAAVAEFTRRGYKGIELMAVPHGQTQDDWLACARTLARIKEITWFGISLERRFGDDNYALVRRRERVSYLSQLPEFARINLHLLGVSESGLELGDDAIWQRANSADVSKYAVWNMLGTPVSPPVPVQIPYPGRGPFGGSYEFFFTGHPKGLSRRKMRQNLTKWTEYARREID